MTSSDVPPTPRVFAIVPAAGLSQRMGVAKLALELGGKTVLGRVVESLVAARLDAVVVVLGETSTPLESLVSPPAIALKLHHDTPDMRTTVVEGLNYLTARFAPESTDAFLLALGDQPTIQTSVVELLVAAHRACPTRIRIPSFSGKRGHPVLFPWSLTAELTALPADRGLNELVRVHPELVDELAAGTADVLEDLDVPADYERLQARPWR